jgi:hypothetical protein
MVKIVEELKVDVREGIRAVVITTRWSSSPGIEVHGEDGGGGVEDGSKGGHQGC